MIDLSKKIAFSPVNQLTTFYRDVVNGLTSPQKFLYSKYFYDAAGDWLFQQIMRCPEYYLTPCEKEILAHHHADIVRIISSFAKMVDVIELGPGDASKSCYLLRELVDRKMISRFLPIDISSNILNQIEQTLPLKIPGLNIRTLQGDYIDQLGNTRSGNAQRLVLFMGANIGNFTPGEAENFCRQVRAHLYPGDLLMIGFDLKKSPDIILDAYNDKSGITKQFNLNLLKRINRELNADFKLSAFEHAPTYDSQTGACKSFLVSLSEQCVRIGSDVEIHFSDGEQIYMEISQKYSVDQINLLAAVSGFSPVRNFFDSKGWFVDALWECK
jgi:dimethylhistidine N-methyltransferase